MGLACVLFYLVFCSILITRTGKEPGAYLWNSALALLFLGIGLFRNQTKIIFAALALAFPQNLIWLLESLFRIFKSDSPLGLTDYLFIPGMHFDEFILHQHPLVYFLLLVFILPRLKSVGKSTYVYLGALHFPIFFLSYYLFNTDTNPNCAIEACLPFFDELPQGIYPIIYFIFYSLVCVIVLKLFRTNALQGFFKVLSSQRGLSVCSILALSLFTKNIWTYQNSPHFTCLASTEEGPVSLSCHYTTEYIPNFFKLIFNVENKTESGQDCVLNIENEGKIEQMYQSVVLRPKRKLALGITMPYPAKDMRVKLSSQCKALD